MIKQSEDPPRASGDKPCDDPFESNFFKSTPRKRG